MARKVKSSESTSSSKKIRPALTPEARELQMISLAVDLAEKQLLELEKLWNGFRVMLR